MPLWGRTEERSLCECSLCFSPRSGCKGGAYSFWSFSMWAVTMWGNPISCVRVLFSLSSGLAGVLSLKLWMWGVRGVAPLIRLCLLSSHYLGRGRHEGPSERRGRLLRKACGSLIKLDAGEMTIGRKLCPLSSSFLPKWKSLLPENSWFDSLLDGHT